MLVWVGWFPMKDFQALLFSARSLLNLRAQTRLKASGDLWVKKCEGVVSNTGSDCPLNNGPRVDVGQPNSIQKMTHK